MCKTPVLFADDDVVSLRFLCDEFEACGLDVRPFNNGRDCWRAFKMMPDCQLCIINIGLPKLKGLSLVKKIRQVHSWLPIIGISGPITSKAKIEAIKGESMNFNCKQIKKKHLCTIEEDSLKIKTIYRQGYQLRSQIAS